MKTKTLLSRRIIATVLVVVLLVGLNFLLVGCSSMLKIVEKIEEEGRLEEEIEKEESRKETLNAKIEEIYLKCLEGNEILEQEFNKLLEENFGDKERILSCLERQRIYNENQYNEYLKKEEELVEALNEKQISKKEFEIRKEQLWNEYLEDKNNIYDYLTEEEEKILDNCEEELGNLYQTQ